MTSPSAQPAPNASMPLVLATALLLSACFSPTPVCAEGDELVRGRCVRAEAGPDADAGPDAEAGVPDAPDVDDAADSAPPSACDAGCVDGSLCDEDAGACVECLEESDCDVDETCSLAHACVDCVGDEGCAGATPRCDTSTEICVACLTSDDCPLAAESRCDTGTHACAGCTGDDDCTHVAGTPVCDEVLGCVECSIATEASCGGNSCNPASGACSGTPVSSVDNCRACVADGECDDPASLCVPMEFQGTPREDGYCLRRMSEGCARPFAVTTDDRASVSGTMAEPFCGIDEETTTCEAVLDLVHSSSHGGTGGETCTTDADCGVDGLVDGLCRTVEGIASRCTYACAADDDCPAARDCHASGGEQWYCGG